MVTRKKQAIMQLVVDNPFNGDFYNTELELPATKAEIKDAMHRGRAVGRNPETFGMVITQCTALPDLALVDFDRPTIEELNFFVKRLEQLTEREQTALNWVFNQRMEEEAYRKGVPMKELINLTYGLDSVMIAPGVENDAQLGQFVIENDLNEDVSSIPENALYLLDKSWIGKLQREIEGGEYVDGNYIVTTAYELPEFYDGVHLPELPGQTEDEEDYVFRLEVVKAPEGEQERQPEDRQWISLPVAKEKADSRIRERYGESMQNCVYYGFQSAIPQIDEEMFGTMQEFDLLNEIAERYSVMSDMEQITFKAVLEHERPENLAEAVEVMEHLPEYQLDYVSWDEADFFASHLLHHLDTEYDARWLHNFTFRKEDALLIEQLGAGVTGYGIVSARGESLYRLASYPESKTGVSDSEQWEVVEVLGRKALFANERIKTEDIPEGMYRYDLRDNGQGWFSSIEKSVKVNHAGTLLFTEDIELNAGEYIAFADGDSPNFLGYTMTVEEFRNMQEQENQMGGMQL